MAQRRMFSPLIVESEEFLMMPVSSQALYFHLGMNADDDGFIQPKIVMRTTGANDDDLKVLLTKRFLLAFESGVVVIKHWLIHNLIQKDRYHPTRFQEEKKALVIKDNKAYSDSVNKMLPEVRLGKVRLNTTSEAELRVEYGTDENKELKPKSKPKYPNKEAVFSLFPRREFGWNMNTTECKYAELLFAEKGLEDIASALRFHEKYKNEPFFPEIDKPSELYNKWVKLEAKLKKYG